MKSDQNFTLYKTHKVSLESGDITVSVVQTPWNYSAVQLDGDLKQFFSDSAFKTD